jgi:uncharacterized alkaline shock family protein YloU
LLIYINSEIIITNGIQDVKMKVYSLTGKSGTGKSYRAQALCIDRGIESIIDDGLFIYRESIEAGRSAKREKTKLGATKAAIFQNEAYRAAVKDKIKEIKPESILIVATSDRMADIIASRLELGQVKERIYIEDISSEDERRAAKRQRESEGEHVIPASTFQLKHDFAGYFLDPMKLWKKALSISERATEAIRSDGITGAINKLGHDNVKTVVRPTYSYMGEFIISERVVPDIVYCAAEETEGVEKVLHIYSNTSPENLTVEVTIYLSGSGNIRETALSYQKRLRDMIELMTAFNVVEVNLEVQDLA